jgi:hypothetical protein
MTISKRDIGLAQLDIVHFYRVYQKSCPSCGFDLSKLHPLSNLVPHFDRVCEPLELPKTRWPEGAEL